MTPITKYLSFDNVEFHTPEDCLRHEAENFAARLVGLTIEQVKAALAREDAEMAEALESAGKGITKARLEAGERKRPGRVAGRSEGAKAPPPEFSEHAKAAETLMDQEQATWLRPGERPSDTESEAENG